MGAGVGEDPGPGRDRRARDRAEHDRAGRGYFIACPRTWRRIRIECSAGASVAWLSARYGPAERTIAARAKKEGWRKADMARLRGEALAAEDEAEAEVVRMQAEVRARRGEDAAKADGEAGGEETTRGEVDMGAARRLAQVKAIAALERDDAVGAQGFMKLAQMLDGDGADRDGAGAPSPQDAAALAYVLERLEAAE